MGQLDALDVKMEKVVERYDAATGKLAGINARIAANQRTLTVTRYDLQMAKSHAASSASWRCTSNAPSSCST